MITRVPRRIIALLVVSLAFQSSLVLASAIRQSVLQADDHDGIHGSRRKGGVSSEATECSAIGRDLLIRGGNAVDALVGTTFCVGVIGMYHSGIGGGGLLIVRDGEGKYEAVDFRESAPAAAYEDMFRDNVHGSVVGGLAVAVPGEVRGLEYAHEKYGVLPWKKVMKGAIHIARHGFRVSEDLVRYSENAIRNKPNFLVEDPIWAEDFAPNGTLVKAGDIMTRKRYARTLEKISELGYKAFYSGGTAESMIDFIQQNNGTMTLDDLKHYKVISRNVTNTTYRGINLHGIGSPGGGAVCLSILKTMEQYSPSDWNDRPLTMHRFDEAMRFAYGARLGLGDPDFVQGIASVESQMLSEARAEKIKSKIEDDQTLPVQAYNPAGLYSSDGHGTSHISTADSSGMATSLTTTINLLFGARIMDPISGVILNNEMNDFSIPGVPNEFGFPPSQANFIRPHKRPLSSMTPLIASNPDDGTLLATVGAAGGSRIISSTAFVLWHALEHNMSLTEALDQPRLHDQLMPNHARVEYAMDDATVEGLKKRGHAVEFVAPVLSAVQGVWRRRDGSFEAAREPRQKNSGGFTV